MALFEQEGNFNQAGADLLSLFEPKVFSLFENQLNKGYPFAEINTVLMQETFTVVMMMIFGGYENTAKQTYSTPGDEKAIAEQTPGTTLFQSEGGLMNENAMLLCRAFHEIISKTVSEHYLKKESAQEITYVVLSSINAARINLLQIKK